MTKARPTLALTTTVYPGVEPYLAAWYASVRAQTDQDFDLWIGADLISQEAVSAACGVPVEANWIPGISGDTPATIRQRAFTHLTDTYEAVVMVDSDDVLHPSRVAAARTALQENDLVACALQFVDQEGRDLHETFTMPDTAPEVLLPRHNVFGLSNTVFRSKTLRRCLPIPDESILVDWFLATRAWLYGERLAYDPVVRMDYRQHSTNTARVRGPFDAARVRQDTQRVLHHFRLLLKTDTAGYLPERLTSLRHVAEQVRAFHQFIEAHPQNLATYVAELNTLDLVPLWWLCVAHPQLEKLWTAYIEIEV